MNAKYLFTIASAFLLIQPSFAQEKKDSTISKSVTVEREYVPTIKNAGKIATSPSVEEPQKVRLDTYYSDFNHPLSLGNNIHPLGSATILYDRNVDDRLGFARFGIGSYPNTWGDFAYPIIQQSDMRLDAVVRHRGAYGAKLNTISTANLMFDKYLESLTIFAGIEGGYSAARFYGSDYNSLGATVDLNTITNAYPNTRYKEKDFTKIARDPKEVSLSSLSSISDYAGYWRFGANVGFRSAADAENWKYLGQINYGLFHNVAGVSEHIVHTNGSLSFNFSEDRIGLDLDLYNGFYSSISKLNYWDSFTILKLNPYYELNRNENWNLRLGLSTAIPFNNEKGINVSPDVRFDWKVLPEWLGLYAGLTGDYRINTMNRLFAENLYLVSDSRAKDTYTPIEFYLGMKLKPMHNLLFDIYADFSSFNNQYFFVNKGYEYSTGATPASGYNDIYTNHFDYVYDDGTLFRTGARISYYYLDKASVELKGVYNAWSLQNEKYAWNKPQYELDLNTSFRVTKDINITLNGFYQGGLYARLGTKSVSMKSRIDLNLGASYTYFDWLTFFAKVNNLINSKYDVFYGYEVQGINLMVGAAISF